MRLVETRLIAEPISTGKGERASVTMDRRSSRMARLRPQNTLPSCAASVSARACLISAAKLRLSMTSFSQKYSSGSGGRAALPFTGEVVRRPNHVVFI